MTQAFVDLLNLIPYSTQCIMPIIGALVTGGLTYLYGAMKGWWML